MYLQFWLKGDNRTFQITDVEELLKLMCDYGRHKTDSITGGYYTFEVEGGERFQNKSIIFHEISKMEFNF
jgi:hypothetical protein